MASNDIALYYRVFFLFIEPLFAVFGAACAALYPGHYLAMTEHLPSSISILPLGIHISLRQLANMYLLFALNEALVLRATTDQRVWRMLLVNLAVADIGHLISVAPLGVGIYGDITRWNSMDWGNIPFVYLGLISRLCFLMGWGVKSKRE